jgi:hypothetical protein
LGNLESALLDSLKLSSREIKPSTQKVELTGSRMHLFAIFCGIFLRLLGLTAFEVLHNLCALAKCAFYRLPMPAGRGIAA